MILEEKLKIFYEYLKKIKLYNHALGLISFDLETIAPENGKEEESELISYFRNEAFKIENSEEYKKLLCGLYEEKDSLSYLDKVLVEKKYRNYLKIKNITPEFDMKMSKIYLKSQLNWLKAKENKDFSIFASSLKEVIDIQKEAINLRENKLPNMYDNMLDDSETGARVEYLDKFFSELKVGLLDLLDKIKKSKHVIRKDFLNRRVPIYKQEEFSKYLLELNGFDFKKGALSTTEHPFTSNIAENDARVTTHYYEDMVLSNIYSIIHEGGHAIFMQNEPSEDYEHFINDYITNGMHESVSRFYENVIGRSREYVHLIYPKFIEIFDEFKDISEEELYESINIVEPSLIRTEADEVTYGLHIIIRYELEKMLCDGSLAIEDAPKKWADLYEEYLGVRPSNDSEGILQDVHWSTGLGYFPSYAIGNAYNAMYVKKAKEDFDFKKALICGDFEKIRSWMKENVFKNANRLDPNEWIKEITGKSLTPKDFLEYLNKKYSDIYKF